MSHDEVQLVNLACGMGFPLERVARAVKNLDSKEREVCDRERYYVKVGQKFVSLNYV